MIKVPKKFESRVKENLKKFQKILEGAKIRDVNESDTVVIVADFLSEVLGYDKYTEITSEFSIRSTFCDLAIVTNDSIRFLIEVKAIGLDLKENHLKQAVDYGANQGVEWVCLTNGIHWQVHRIKFEKPISADFVFEIDLLHTELKVADYLEPLFLLSKEACTSSQIDEYYEKREATSKFVIAQVILSDPVLKSIRREVRRISEGVSISEDEIAQIIETDILKRDTINCDEADQAKQSVRKGLNRPLRKRKPKKDGEERSENPDSGAGEAAVERSQPVQRENEGL